MDRSFLTNIWYFASASSSIKTGQLIHRQICKHPMVLGRTQSGKVFALHDNCPHRGIPLSEGKIIGEEVQCCYHGWSFSTNGLCTSIPSLADKTEIDRSKISVRTYPIKEYQGLIWVWLGNGDGQNVDPPTVPEVENQGPQVSHVLEFPVNIDHAVVGLIDPAHTPHVHESWFWRKPSGRTKKEKKFKPSQLGFEMLPHLASKNSKIYRLIGGAPEVRIWFALPGIRIEQIKAGKNFYCGMTACTPINENNTLTTHMMWWSMKWANFLKPVVRHFARTFLKQDQTAFMKQSKGLQWHPPLRLAGQPDQQAKWYFRIKNEWARTEDDGKEFKNPLKETTLKWRT